MEQFLKDNNIPYEEKKSQYTGKFGYKVSLCENWYILIESSEKAFLVRKKDGVIVMAAPRRVIDGRVSFTAQSLIKRLWEIREYLAVCDERLRKITTKNIDDKTNLTIKTRLTEKLLFLSESKIIRVGTAGFEVDCDDFEEMEFEWASVDDCVEKLLNKMRLLTSQMIEANTAFEKAVKP